MLHIVKSIIGLLFVIVFINCGGRNIQKVSEENNENVIEEVDEKICDDIQMILERSSWVGKKENVGEDGITYGYYVQVSFVNSVECYIEELVMIMEFPYDGFGMTYKGTYECKGCEIIITTTADIENGTIEMKNTLYWDYDKIKYNSYNYGKFILKVPELNRPHA